MALFWAWQLTMQAGMGAWKDLQSVVEDPKSKKQLEKEANFISIWSHEGVFYKYENRLKW